MLTKKVDTVLKVLNKAIDDLYAVEEQQQAIADKAYQCAAAAHARARNAQAEQERAARVRSKLEELIR